MLRQAGRACQTTTHAAAPPYTYTCTYARFRPWPVDARRPLHLLHPPHSRALQTTSAHYAVDKSGPRPSHIPKALWRDYRLWKPTSEGGSDVSKVLNKWKLPRNRLPMWERHILRNPHRPPPPNDIEREVRKFKDWQRKFNYLWQRFEVGGEPPRCHGRSTGMVQVKKLLRFESVEDMRAHWFAKPQLKRMLPWRHTMLSAMNFYPERAAEVLQATFEPGVTPLWAVSDTVCFLARWTSKLPDDLKKGHESALPRLLISLLHRSPRRPWPLILPQWVIGHAASVCEPDTAAELYSVLRKKGPPLYYNNLLQLAGRLVRDGKYRLLAVRLLEFAVNERKLPIDDRPAAALATNLTTLPLDWNSGRYSAVDVHAVVETFERVAALGHSPNILTYSALIRSLCRTNQLEMAWRIYDVIRDQGGTVNLKTFRNLMLGAQESACLDTAIRVLEEAPPECFRADTQSGKGAVHDLLNVILTAATREDRANRTERGALPIFTPMLRVYSKLCSLEPLQRLIPSDLRARLETGGPEDTQLRHMPVGQKLPELIAKTPDNGTDKLYPNARILGLMVIAYVKGLSNLESLQRFYEHFQALLTAGDPVAVGLAERNTLPYDAILMQLTNKFGMIQHALKFVNHMAENAALQGPLPPIPPHRPTAPPAPPVDLPTEDGSTPDTPATESVPLHSLPPSNYTWNILLEGALRTGSTGLAQGVLSNMRAAGVEPDLATYNILIGGHARRQRVADVVGFLEMLHDDGFYPDEHTIRAVARLTNPAKILEAMEKATNRREARRWRELDKTESLGGPRRLVAVDRIERRSVVRRDELDEADDLDELDEAEEWRDLTGTSGQPHAAARAAEQMSKKKVVKEDEEQEMEQALSELRLEPMERVGWKISDDGGVMPPADPALDAAIARSQRPRKKMRNKDEVDAYMDLYNELFDESTRSDPVEADGDEGVQGRVGDAETETLRETHTGVGEVPRETSPPKKERARTPA